MKYLLDTNIYISFYDEYYPLKHFPSFWNKIENILNEKVVIPKVVANEAYQGSWFIKEFLPQKYHQDIINHDKYHKEYGEVLEYIANSPRYTNKALIGDTSWTNAKIADGWLIAIAKKEGYTIVTAEKPNPNLNDKNPANKCKIPDIAKEFGVECINMLEFFREVNLEI